MSFYIYERLLNNQPVDTKELISALRILGCLKETIKCESCEIPMNEAKIKTGDFICFRCNNCEKKKSIRTGTLFFKSKLKLSEILRMLACFSDDKSSLSVQENYYFSKESVIKWFKLFRSFMTKETSQHFEKLGGPSCIVEIDETLISKRKYNRGRLIQQKLLFGVIDRQTHEIFVKCVDKRSKAILGNIIKQVIEEESIVMSDQWPAYMSFFGRDEPDFYQHFSVNHSENFVDPETGAHTQTIENLWLLIKKRLRKFSLTNRKYLESYLDEFCFRRRFKNTSKPGYEIFKTLLKHCITE